MVVQKESLLYLGRCPYLWWKQGQSYVRKQHCQVLLPPLHILTYPLHDSIENGFFIRHINVITAQKFAELISWKQEEFFILYYLDEVFLEKKGLLLKPRTLEPS